MDNIYEEHIINRTAFKMIAAEQDGEWSPLLRWDKAVGCLREAEYISGPLYYILTNAMDNIITHRE